MTVRGAARVWGWLRRSAGSRHTSTTAATTPHDAAPIVAAAVAPAAASTAVTLRKIAPSVYLPIVVYEIGNGAIGPVVALTAVSLGASPTTAGYVVSLLGVGQILGNIPSSWLANRFGDRGAMIIASCVAITAMFVCLVAPSVAILGLGLLLIGMCNSTFYLARLSYITDVAPLQLRARAMSTLGGAHRFGLFIGPFIGAGAIALIGLRAAFGVAMISAAVSATLLIVIPEVTRTTRRATTSRRTVGPRQMLLAKKRLFATLGVTILAAGAVRAARQTVLPLWGQHIGLSPEQNSLIFGIAGAVDVALFYPGGKLMDEFGRLAVALPSLLFLGLGMLVLPLTGSAIAFTLAAVIMSIGNGIGSGIMSTLGADAAPVQNRVEFFSIWRVLSDTGNAAGPLLVAVIATASTLAFGIVGIGAVAIGAAAGFARWVPKYSTLATSGMVRAHRAQERAEATPPATPVPSPE